MQRRRKEMRGSSAWQDTRGVGPVSPVSTHASAESSRDRSDSYRPKEKRAGHRNSHHGEDAVYKQVKLHGAASAQFSDNGAFVCTLYNHCVMEV